MSEIEKTTTLVEELDGIYSVLVQETLNADIPNDEKSMFRQKIQHLSMVRTNIMIAGATGAGKSSTISALFRIDEAAEVDKNNDAAQIGVGAGPETAHIQRYQIGNLILWDTPGLGDGHDADIAHTGTTKPIVRMQYLKGSCRRN